VIQIPVSLTYKKIIKNQEDSAMKTKNNSLSFKGKDFFIGTYVVMQQEFDS